MDGSRGMELPSISMFSVDVSRGNQRGAPGTIPFLGFMDPMRNSPQKIISWDLHLSESDRGRSGLYFFSAHPGVGFPHGMCNIESDAL